ncbi:response regulator transcription factor [Pseudorhodobacter sp.]|uniref:response regulator transcription factor n=1 Tax=Pseudorhodobacter sp. TaxID=1934400 RepID=UPI002AFE39A0|nr:response regulator [Pseudorhodobacter sp.]
MGRHVLLIEDEPNIAEAIRFILNRDGWQVSTHANGADAVAQVNRLRPDVLILDVMLPGQSGYDILGQLRQLPECAALPVLMLTAKSQGRDRDAAQQFGADMFITKPFSNADILAAVRSLAQGESGDAGKVAE